MHSPPFLLLHITTRCGSILIHDVSPWSIVDGVLPDPSGVFTVPIHPGTGGKSEFEAQHSMDVGVGNGRAPERQEYFALAEAVCSFILVFFYSLGLFNLSCSGLGVMGASYSPPAQIRPEC